MASSIAQYVAIVVQHDELASWSPHAFVGYKDDNFRFQRKCPLYMNTRNFARAIATMLWIYLFLLSILVPLEIEQIFIRLLSLLALDILLAVWLLAYRRRN